MSPDLLKSFEETNYIVHHKPQITMRIGQTCPELQELLKAGGYTSAAFITAWNPYSQPLSEAANATRQCMLQSDINALHLTNMPGIGQHPSNNWPGEESLFVLGIDQDAARALARKYEQWAFVWIPASGIPEIAS